MNTKKRIERILKEFAVKEIDKQILKLELETLVLQAKLERLKEDK